MAENNLNRAHYQSIADYGIIGDCHTIALIGLNGSIDWYCPGRFDAQAVFCRLLDIKKGGYYMVAPVGRFSVERHYLGYTNILETIFTKVNAKVRMTDFMPVHRRTLTRRGHDVGTSRRILRLVEGLEGALELEIHFNPSFDYARGNTEIRPEPGVGGIAYKDGQYISLSCPGFDLKLKPDNKVGLLGRLRLHAGERRWLVLTDSDDPDRAVEMPTQSQCEQQLSRTQEYWEDWLENCIYRGPYREEVLRSVLTLKLLTYEPTGAIVAAPTTSLPEEIGGVRNWDYRYAWLRDSALIIYALMNVGYEEEAADFFEWLQETHQNNPGRKLQIMYGIDGRTDLREAVLGHLEGYRCSKPVRIGNEAAKQLQLDIYGEVLTAAYLYFKSGIGNRGDSHEEFLTRQRILEKDWPILRGLVDQAAERWQEPDNGIWEVRGGLQPFLYSKLMCWTALDRGIRLAQEFSLPAALNMWRTTRDLIQQLILTSGYNKEKGAFTQIIGSSDLDASVLLISRVGFLPPTDSRVQSTLEHIRAELTHNGLVYRYRSKDGLPGGEATFATCTFWMVDVLALSGRLKEAHDLFERIVSYANNLGLFSEEVDPMSGELLGNFPQGFTHMALINSAVNLAKAAKHGAEQLPETEFERANKAGHAVKEGYSVSKSRDNSSSVKHPNNLHRNTLLKDKERSSKQIRE
jgi:GH15 family glucan-1,4-alpha-glucosidase